MATNSLEKRIERLEAVHEIENMVNRYEYVLTGGHSEKVMEMFAQKTPGVRLEIMGFGVYEGIEGVRRCYGEIHAPNRADITPGTGIAQPGVMYQSTNTTPVIEVAGDGKTAKGVWICPGHMTMVVGGKLQAYWWWSKRAFDFVKEDGKWKIWHYNVYATFICPYDKSWVEFTNTKEIFESLSQVPKELLGDRPPTHQWIYSPTATVEYVPAAPEPYETFNEKTAY